MRPTLLLFFETVNKNIYKCAIRGLFSFIFVLEVKKNCQATVFEPEIDRSTNCATTTALLK